MQNWQRTACQQLRAQGQPTLPGSISQEIQINPFFAHSVSQRPGCRSPLMRQPMTKPPYLPRCGNGKTNSNDASLPNRFFPLFFFLNVRLVSLALLLVMSVWAGCTKPGLPDDPVLATVPAPLPGNTFPEGAGCAITPSQIGSYSIASTEPPKELYGIVFAGALPCPTCKTNY